MAEVAANNGVKSVGSGFATTALVIGIVAAVFGWTGIFGIILAVPAIVFGIIALIKKQSKAKSIWGLALGGVALITGVIITIIAIAAVNQVVSNDPGSTTEISEAVDQTYTVGQAIDLGDRTVTATSVERNWTPSSEYVTAAEDGKEYVKVNLSIKNTSSDDQISYNAFEWTVQDSKGVITDIDSAVFLVDGALNSGELAPNGELNSFVVFQVPAGDTGLVLGYSPSIFTDDTIRITL